MKNERRKERVGNPRNPLLDHIVSLWQFPIKYVTLNLKGVKERGMLCGGNVEFCETNLIEFLMCLRFWILNLWFEV
jgi:hypothetical protein